MKIGKYISELLYTHDRVILPGFGSFSTVYVPAKFVAEKNIVEAPARIADFSPAPREGHTPLTPVIAKREGMTEAAVNDFYRKLVREITQSLESGKKVELENIGLFQMNEEGEIQFSPDRSVNYLKEDTGVGHIKAPAFTPSSEEETPGDTDENPPADEEITTSPPQTAPGQEDEAAPEPETTTEPETSIDPDTNTEPETETAMKEKDETTNENRRSSGGLKWLFYIGIPLLVILLILFLRFDYFFGGEGLFRRQATVEQVDPAPTAPVGTDEPTAVKEPEEETTEPEPVPSDPDIEPPPPETGRPVYYIVIGSFRNETEAQELARELRSDGAPLASVFMQTPAEYHRVCYGYYYDLEEAESMKASLDDELREKAWILHR
ncbi:MAG: SPOR domain-containing protein [Bacteroidales bacterium]